MKIVTWNVNSIRARLERVVAWLESTSPDVVCLQEIKVRDEDFPYDAIEATGYHAAVFGQPTYNGVAVLAKEEPKEIRRGFHMGDEDPQSRLIAASFGDVRVISVYVPNGSEVGSEKYEYKLGWLERLMEYLDRYEDRTKKLAVCGDYNIAFDDKDVSEPDEWRGSVLYNDEMTERLTRLLDWGMTDTVRQMHPDGGVLSWWDYRRLAFPRNDGLRIDHILATAPLAESLQSAYVDRDERKGKKPSDHAPVVAEFGQ
jgi:exodeoxyribonuclease-3